MCQSVAVLRSCPTKHHDCTSSTRSAVYALAVYFKCSPIYVVNRDDDEVSTMVASFKQNATLDFDPECVHIKTPEEAASLPTPSLM